MLAAAATILVAAAPAHASAPVVEQMVVGKDGAAKKIATVRASATRVRIGARRCAVGAGTPLAALVRGRVGTLRIKDFGSCSSRARDAGGLYVRGIGRDVVSGPGDPDGWVYKVGNRAAPAGAGDPSGPFGRGPLRSKQRVLWFWCVSLPAQDGCQRTLDLKVDDVATKEQTVHVVAYDNSGKGVPAAGATVSDADGPIATTDARGSATFSTNAGTHALFASKDGLVRSFPVRIEVP